MLTSYSEKNGNPSLEVNAAAKNLKSYSGYISCSPTENAPTLGMTFSYEGNRTLFLEIPLEAAQYISQKLQNFNERVARRGN